VLISALRCWHACLKTCLGASAHKTAPTGETSLESGTCPVPILPPIALPTAFHVAHPLFALLIFLLFAVLVHVPCFPNLPFLYP